MPPELIGMTKYIKAYPLIFLFLISTQVLGQQEKIYLICNLTSTTKFRSVFRISESTVISKEQGVSLDPKTGAILAGSIAEGWNKIAGFKSGLSDTEFYGYLGYSNYLVNKPNETIYVLAHYSIDRLTGLFDGVAWKRSLKANGTFDLDEDQIITQKGKCEAVKDGKF